MNSTFADMQAVRNAFDALQNAPGDAAALAAFQAAYAQHRDDYVDSFEAGGATYPRTDGHRLSESQARQAIDRALADGARPQDLKPGVMGIAYPLPTEVLRTEIEETVRIAKTINALDWRVASLSDKDADRVRELLRMPTVIGSYKHLRKLADKRTRGRYSRYRGYQADHPIPDKALRGVSTLRKDSTTEAAAIATFLQDGQNKGSQHKFATDAQNAVRSEFELLGRNPTVAEYLLRVHAWMSKIYTCADLVVDGSVQGELMKDAADFATFQVKGYAVAQAGFMTWPERAAVGSAIATALLIKTRELMTANGWDLARELPLVSDIAPLPTPSPPPLPTIGTP